MLTINKAKKRKAKAKRINPLRADPSRTAGIRRDFERKLRRAFSSLKAEIVRLVVTEDAFGLGDGAPRVLNAFCATGPGGGIDPTCSPSSTTETMGDIVAQDEDLISRKTTLGGKLLSPSEYHAGYYKTFPIVYRGASVESSGDHHVFVTPDKELAAAHGKVVAYRLLPGATIYPDPEGIEELDDVLGRQATGWDSFNESRSAVVKQSELGPKNQPKKVANNKLAPRPLRADPSHEITTNAGRWAFATRTEQLKAFRKWLRRELGKRVAGADEEKLWRAYVEQGLRKGQGRVFDDMVSRRPELTKEGADFARGTKAQFLESAFRQPESVEKVKLIAGRAFDELEGVTAEMSSKMARVLADGLVEGKHPNDVANDLMERVDIGEHRAKTIARTEIIRAHAEGQLLAMEAMGVEEVGVMVEWATASDDAVCPKCAALEGVVLKLDEAKNLIPRHPNCRCAFIPANVGEDTDEQKRGKREVESAFEESGLDVDIDEERPESILNQFSAMLDKF